MRARAILSLVMIFTVTFGPTTSTLARDAASASETQVESCSEMTAFQNASTGHRPDERLVSHQVAAGQASWLLTQQRVVDALETIHNNDFPTPNNSDAVEQYSAYADNLLSPIGKGVQAALMAEIDALGIPAHELDTRDEELTTPDTHPDWDIYVQEADSIFNSLPSGGYTGGRFIFGLTLAALAAVVLCDAKIQACAQDVLEAHEDCIENRVCDEGECADKDCCNEKAENDGYNCLTCGFNGPDDDYDNCCE